MTEAAREDRDEWGRYYALSFRRASGARKEESGVFRHLHFCRLSPAVCQIFPGWIAFFDETHLLLAPPFFDLRFATDSITDVLERLKIYQPVHPISSCEGPTLARTVPEHSGHEESCDANVNDAALACQDVDVISALKSHWIGFITNPGWMP